MPSLAAAAKLRPGGKTYRVVESGAMHRTVRTGGWGAKPKETLKFQTRPTGPGGYLPEPGKIVRGGGLTRAGKAAAGGSGIVLVSGSGEMYRRKTIHKAGWSDAARKAAVLARGHKVSSYKPPYGVKGKASHRTGGFILRPKSTFKGTTENGTPIKGTHGGGMTRGAQTLAIYGGTYGAYKYLDHGAKKDAKARAEVNARRRAAAKAAREAKAPEVSKAFGGRTAGKLAENMLKSKPMKWGDQKVVLKPTGKKK